METCLYFDQKVVTAHPGVCKEQGDPVGVPRLDLGHDRFRVGRFAHENVPVERPDVYPPARADTVCGQVFTVDERVERTHDLPCLFLGALLGGLAAEAIGISAALLPRFWLGIFTKDAGALAVGAVYLQWTGLFYGFFGLGLCLYFAGLGRGRVLLPLLAGTARLAVTALAVFSTARSADIARLALLVGSGMLVYGVINALAAHRALRPDEDTHATEWCSESA
jgi:hypothetical protein